MRIARVALTCLLLAATARAGRKRETLERNQHSGSVAALTFDEGQGAKDWSPSGNDGTPTSVGYVNAAGFIGGGAYVFDAAASVIDIGNDVGLTFGANDPFTIGGWCRYTNTSGWAILLRKGEGVGTTRNYNIIINMANGVVIFQWYNGANRDTRYEFIAPNASFCLVGTWDGTYARLYVNGVFQESNDYSGNPPLTNSYSATIGTSSDGSSDMKGYIEEIIIVSECLSSNEVMAYYQTGKASQE